MDSLQDEITNALRQSPWERKDFLPNSSFEELITREKIGSVSDIHPDIAFNESRKVIAILLYIERLDAFTTFHSEGLTDEYLPVHLDKDKRVMVSHHKGKRFTSFSSSTHCQNFVRN